MAPGQDRVKVSRITLVTVSLQHCKLMKIPNNGFLGMAGLGSLRKSSEWIFVFSQHVRLKAGMAPKASSPSVYREQP